VPSHTSYSYPEVSPSVLSIYPSVLPAWQNRAAVVIHALVFRATALVSRLGGWSR
jgi:hypothetical protein